MAKAGKGKIDGINVTPMVDIMLVLLVIFMVTANFVSEKEHKVNLPQTVSGDSASTASLTVSVAADGSYALMDKAVSISDLQSQLSRETGLNPGVRVTLRADEKLDYGKIMQAVDLLKRSGVQRIGLAALTR